MLRIRSMRPLGICVAIAIGIVSFACAATKSSKYVGRWECHAKGKTYFFDIKANSGAFLVSDETPTTYAAQLDNNGTLVLTGVPYAGSVALPIDDSNGELISPGDKCTRFTRTSQTPSKS